ncbi:MAG: NTP transferase domain-containing protein [bacterium]|nr:NTP transferase domain-containing protein [bacterium]
MEADKAVIVLAAGKGKRMKSDLPKVLHQIDGIPMIKILLNRLIPMGFARIVVVIGHQGEMVRNELSNYPVEFAWQREQNGTGHAVMMTREFMGDFEGTTLVAAGDVPYLSQESIVGLFRAHQEAGAVATCLSAVFDDPTGYGRIIRDGDAGLLREIVEHKDASEKILKINEINSGTFCFDNQRLFATIDEIDTDNAQGEYYLTDAVKILHGKGLKVAVVTASNPDEVRGVNSVDQLQELAQKFADR